jgi:cell division protein ZipA
MSLRTLLIIIGVLIVIAVYAFSARRRRRDLRIGVARRFARVDIPDVILQHPDDDVAEEEDVVPIADDDFAPRLPPEVRLPDDEPSTRELPVVRNDSVPRPAPANTRRKIDQMDLFGAADPPARKAPAPEEPPDPAAGLITLFVCARSGQHFTGPALVKAFNAVGLQYGDMSIFHHFGAGELRCDTAVFSAANMYEPGTFDLGKIEAFRTAGVALFMQLPGPLDGPVAFELLLNTAQRLTELTGGELAQKPGTPLDSAGIARLRKRSARFTHARA